MESLPNTQTDFFDKQILTEQEVRELTYLMAWDIIKDYRENTESPLVIVSIYEGAEIFTNVLCDELNRIDPGFKIETATMTISTSTKDNRLRNPVLTRDLSSNISNRDTLLVDDILDRGKTLEFGYKYLKTKNPRSLKTAVMAERIDGSCERLISPDYRAFPLTSKGWIYGMGPDDGRLQGDGGRSDPGIFINHPI